MKPVFWATVCVLLLSSPFRPLNAAVWHCDGSYLDALGTYNGTPEGSMSFSTAVKLSGGASLDFRADRARVIFASDMLNHQIAVIEGWIYPTSGVVDPTTNHSGILWDKSNVRGLENGGLRVAFNYPAGWVSVQINDDNATHSRWKKFTCSIPLGQWTHIAVGWDGSNVYLYKNCLLIGSAPMDAYPSGTDRVSFGAAQDGGGDFDGYMDEVRMTVGVSSPDEMMCFPMAVEPSTWGAIKSIFR